MPERATALTAAAGEHFVAYRLSAMGFPVAMTRGGSPTIDLMVGSISGSTTTSIQVKTSNWANRRFKKKPEKNSWEWDVGKKALEINSENIFYAFVDLRWDKAKNNTPIVFIVPSKDVHSFVKPDWSRYMFWILEKNSNMYLERWDLLTSRL